MLAVISDLKQNTDLISSDGGSDQPGPNVQNDIVTPLPEQFPLKTPTPCALRTRDEGVRASGACSDTESEYQFTENKLKEIVSGATSHARSPRGDLKLTAEQIEMKGASGAVVKIQVRKATKEE